MARRILAVALVLAVLTLAAPPGSAQTSTTSSTTTSTVIVETAVTVEPGTSAPAVYTPPCNDVAVGFEQQLTFTLRRTGPTSQPLTVTYALSGTAQAGVHYEPLPGSVTFEAAAAAATVRVFQKETPQGAIVELTLRVTGGTPLAPATQPSATIRFLSPPPQGPHECGYRFTGDAWNTSQTINLGGAPRALTLEQFAPPVLAPATGRFRVVGGALPPGVDLRADGTFAGAATTVGTFTANVEACRPEPPNTCTATVLTITVTRDPLPRTGPGTDTGDLATAAGAILAGGLVVLALAAPVRPRRRPRQQPHRT